MNEIVRIAPANVSNNANEDVADGLLVVTRPDAQQSIVTFLASGQLVDFRQILSEDISFIRIDGDLQMIFPDGGTVLIQNFFEGDVNSQIALVGEGETLSIDEFTAIANLQLADEIQTASGETTNLATALGGPQGSGQAFEDVSIGDLGDGLRVADLLTGEPPESDGAGADELLTGDGPESDGGSADDETPDLPNSAPVIGGAVEVSLDEANLADGTEPNGAGDLPLTSSGDLGLSFGQNAGTINEISLLFDQDNLPADLTSDGVPLELTFSQNAASPGGEFLTATKTDGSGEIVFTVELIVTGDVQDFGGAYEIILYENLDHDGANQGTSLPLLFGFTTTDFNGDSASSTLTVSVDDDTPVIAGNILGVVTEEADASTGAFTTATVTGSLGINWGADSWDEGQGTVSDGIDRQVGLNVTGGVAVVTAGGTALTSNGEAVLVVITGTSTDGSVTSIEGRTAGDRLVFSLSLDDGSSASDEGSYSFTLHDNVDHLDQTGSGGEDESDALTLSADFTATDSDGDSVTGSFAVVINDDVPDPQFVLLDSTPTRRDPSPGTVRVDETSDGEQHSDNVFDETTGEYDQDVIDLFANVLNSAGGVGSDDDLLPFGPIYARDTVIDVGASLDAGADAPIQDQSLELVLVDAAGADSTGPVSSGLYTTGEADTGPGEEIFLFVEGGLIVGRYDDIGATADANDPAAFAIAIEDDGSISIAQYVSLWHDDPDSSDEDIAIGNDSTVNPGSVWAQLTVTDADGDTVSTREDISDRITFDDDGPDPIEPNPFDPVEVNEADSLETIVSGQLQFDPGADGAVVTNAAVFSDDDGFVSRDDIFLSSFPLIEDTDYLTVGGERVTTDVSTNTATGVITIIGKTETSLQNVFEVVVRPEGSYDFTQLAAFDHPDPGTGDNDPIDLYLDFTVTDGDGDVEGDLTDPLGSEFYEIIRITDDGPELTDVAVTATVDEAGAPVIFDDPAVTSADGFGASVAVFENFLLVGSPRDERNGRDFGDVHLFNLATGDLVHTFDGAGFSRGSFFGGPQFGVSVDMEENLILVGAPFDAQGGPRQGEAHLFDATTGDLITSYDAPLFNGVFRPGEALFGSDVAISGNLLLIGAVGVPDGGTRGGQAYLFDASNPSNPDPSIFIRNPNPSREDRFGDAVDIDGDFLVVSAPSNGTSVGEVHLFDTAGNFILSFTDPSPNSLDFFGSDVAIQGNLVVVGARGDDTTALNGGQVYLYSFDETTGTSQLLHTFDDPEPVQAGFFGFSVAIDGNQVVIGASARDAGGNEGGRSYVFDATTGDLIQTLEDPTPSSFGRDDMGASVSIEGNTIAVGAPGDATQGSDVGQVYVFQAGTGSFIATLDLASTVDFGVDGGGFSLQTFAAQDFGLLTAGGTQVRIVSDGTTISGFVDDGTTDPDNGTLDDDDTILFTLTLDGTDAVFTLLQQFDHGTDDPIALELGQFIDASDGDGDAVTLTGLVTVNVADDVPEIVATLVEDGVINADVLLTSSADDNGISGSLGIDFGADDGNNGSNGTGDRSATFTDTTTAENNVTVTDGTGTGTTLTSNGASVSFDFVNGTLVGYTGADPDANQVFTVSLDDTTVEYTFTLLANLDTLAVPSAAANEINLTFNITATDGDGDSATGEFSVTVTHTGLVRVFDGTTNALKATYTTIQDAIDNVGTLDGDTILLGPGTYDEDVTVDKDLTILGANEDVSGDDASRGTESVVTGSFTFDTGSEDSTIDGVHILQDASAGTTPGIYVVADDITITNMLIERTGGFGNARGVLNEIGDADGLDVSNSKISGFTTGIFLNPGSNATITDNVLQDNFVGLANDGADADAISGNSFMDNQLEQIGIGVETSGATDVSAIVSATNTFTGDVPEVSIYDNSAGNDDITGTGFNDQVTLGAGDDTIGTGAGDDTIFWTVGDGRDIVDGGTDIDTFDVTGEASADETFFIETVTDYNIRTGLGGLLDADTEIVVSRGLAGPTGASTVIAELDGIEDIDVNGLGGADNFVVSGDFTGTDLDPTTITINGGGDGDTVDASEMTSSHSVVFNGNGGGDIFQSGAGDDFFDGGEGSDSISLTGDAADYVLTINADGTITIKDTVVSRDGADTITDSVEVINFDDVMITLTTPDSDTFQSYLDALEAAIGSGGASSDYVRVLESGFDLLVQFNTAGTGLDADFVTAYTLAGAADPAIVEFATLGFSFGGQTYTIDDAGLLVTVSDPIILDLDGDGTELLAGPVVFDIDADGTAETIGWVGPDDGMLVVDLDGSGAIENGSEVFSEVFNDGSFADSLEALASLDDNGDGMIDTQDAAFSDIKVWQDANSDGFSQAGELQSLFEHGISSIDLNAGKVDRAVDGNTVFAEGTYTKVDGSEGVYTGVSFGAANDDTADTEADTNRQSAAVAAGVAMVLYAATAEEVAAGLASVDIKGDTSIGSVDISEDFTVTYTPADGYHGKDVVELELVFAKGTTVTRSIDLDVLSDETPLTTSTVSNSAEAPGTVVNGADASGDNGGTPEATVTVTVAGSVITGDDGGNILVGSNGDDILIGGLGFDTLTGGAGADTFVLNSLAEADIITDYTFGEGDKLDLGQLLANAFGSAADAAEYIRAQRGENGELRVEVGKEGDHAWQEAATLQDHASIGDTIRVVLDTEGTEANIAVNAA
ncbi:DUF5801 repeats-in-toxin domain-containing protein [uncultured Roseibium sp.]|uniref:DUF5801 repeats-in-toxin domain-containing protein n=1 Tax=uncultured Roseibium sp. TaxID=1936171 RepID=UPI00262E9652|nr:DUF5801 repeats-in-toxin domain-containing protein [uncultured Roseibium sp.]